MDASLPPRRERACRQRPIRRVPGLRIQPLFFAFPSDQIHRLRELLVCRVDCVIVGAAWTASRADGVSFDAAFSPVLEYASFPSPSAPEAHDDFGALPFSGSVAADPARLRGAAEPAPYAPAGAATVGP